MRRPVSGAAGVRELTVGLLILCFGPTGEAFGRPTGPDAYVRDEVATLLTDLRENNDFAAARSRADVVFDICVGFVSPSQRDTFREAAFTRRLVDQLTDYPDRARRQAMLAFLLDHRVLAEELAFTIKAQEEDATKVYAAFDRLWQARDAAVADYAALTAALCVVHDQPLNRWVNEHRPTAPDAVLLFDYFTQNEGRMLFGLRNLPPELLVYVVDATATLEDLRWALAQYAGDQAVGLRFFDIRYDQSYYLAGTEKAVNQAGWNLPNILKYGGICADQAHFASTVGKAIGVPAVYTRGRSSTASHAWVGFVQTVGRQVAWNFELGRYEAYKGVRGEVFDPQIRAAIPDSHVALLAELAVTERSQRHAAIALTDAAIRLSTSERRDLDLVWERVSAEKHWSVLPQRNLDDDALRLLEIALSACPGYAPGWLWVGRMAEQGQLSLRDKRHWAGALHRLCGQRYPDFYLDVLSPMIATVKNRQEQEKLWNAAFGIFAAKRHELAAEVRLAQARMWEEAGNKAKAYGYYLEVIGRYVNAGPLAITALARAEDMLIAARKEREVLGLYARAFASARQPENPGARSVPASNWYRIGEMYVKRLEMAGDVQRAAQVRAVLKQFRS